VDARGLLANAYRERGFTDEAIKQYAAAVNLEQDDIGNVGSLAALVDSMGPSKAIEWYQSYLKANPGEGRIRMRLAEQLKLDDKWNDAIAEAKEAVKTKGGNTVANHDNLATMMEVMHDYPGALNEFRAAHDDLEVRQVSRLLGIYPFGIMLSADQDLYPTGRGGPSAIYEVEQALQGGLPNVALYQRPKWYGTVAQYEDQASASAARTQILAAQNGRWKGAAVISIEDWCPNVQFSQTITLAFDGRQQAVSLLICGVRSAAQANPATPTNR
jgi:tetratricopeptide (TPR) repeat protein